jgi:hypothetical protein
MKKQYVHRDYNFSDADLYVQCIERTQYVVRDADGFKQYAYTEEKLNQFKAMCERFRELPSDDELLGEQMLFTEKKNNAAEELRIAIRSVMTRVAGKYDVKSGRYRKFGTLKMNDMSDPQLLLCGRRVARVAEQQLDFLHDTGLRQVHIDQIRQAATAFETSLHIQQDKVADRDIAVEVRTDLGNELYNELVVICNIGKDLWGEANRSKYDNYTLYESNNEEKKARKAKVLSGSAGNS